MCPQWPLTPTAIGHWMSREPRRGLVLGGGGVLGGTWAVGALLALERVRDLNVNGMNTLVGTSAGSVLAALLGAGVTTEQLRAHYNEEPVTDGPLAGYHWDAARATGGSRPGRPRFLGPGSLRLIGQGFRHPGQLPPTAVLSAFLPEGAKSLERVGHLIDAVTPMGEWSSHPGLWVVAMDYDTGKRMVFGRPGAPVAPLADAVMASCAIPGWFAPIRINGRTYIDGGAVSATSVDVLAHAGLDEVFVVAPMVSFAMDNPTSLTARLERRWREQVTATCLREAALLRAAGTKVTVIGPGPEDLEAIGANLMDASRRRHVLQTSLETSTEAWHRAFDVVDSA
jgi:NTE family protein